MAIQADDPETWRPSVSEIIPNLYVGNQASAILPQSYDLVKPTLVINCTYHLPNYWNKRCKYFQIPVGDPGPGAGPDHPEIKIMAWYLPRVIRLIDDELKRGGRVLVHCHAGKQRSAIVVCKYLMVYKYQDMGKGALDQAVAHMLAKRPVVFYGGSNINFIYSV